MITLIMPIFLGTIIEGKNQARGLGYPTANMSYKTAGASRAPDTGVWTCRATLDGQRFDGLAVIGMWKLDNGLPSVEVHLLDFSDDIYGRELSVELVERLRDLISFPDVEALKGQIVKDIEIARGKLSISNF